VEHLRTPVQLAFGARRVASHRPRGSEIGKKWRRGWDLNPRYGFPYARFRGECFQPLSHLSAVGGARLAEELPEPQCCAGSGCSAIQNSRRGGTQRRAPKNVCKSAAHSCSRIPAVISTRWFNLGWVNTSKHVRTAPPFGSSAP
jgi:hypothetical protein